MKNPDNYASEALIKSTSEKNRGKSKCQKVWKRVKYNLDAVVGKNDGKEKNFT